jgi:adenine-specific DNA-methyltransferase
MSKRKNYQAWSKEDLIREIQKLEKRKKYGVVWEDKPEAVAELCKEKLPILVEDESREVASSEDGPVNLLIEGDNYHALSVLNYTHKGRIDLIYVDPPYNTGNKTWKYNNNFIERDDPFKHSKWLSFISKRLSLAKHLLKPDGIIVITIDDYEVFNLGMLMDEIFGESNRLATITVLNKKSGRTTDKHFATCHEYYLVYAKNAQRAKIEQFGAEEEDITEYKFEDEESKYRWRDFLRTGGFSTPKERPNSYYPIYYSPRTEQIALKKFNGSVEILPTPVQ